MQSQKLKTPEAAPIENLAEVMKLVRKHAPKNVCDWFCGGGDAFFRGDGRLDEALGLAARPTERLPVTVKRYQDRDQALRAALKACGDDPKTLLHEIEEFEKLWPTLQKPRGLSLVQRKLVAAFKIGLPLPKTKRRIEQIRDHE